MSDPLAFLEAVDPATIARCLASEPPLFAGVILGRLSPALAAKVLANMDGTRQQAVVGKMGKSRAAPPHVIERVALTMRQKLTSDVERGGKPEPNLHTWQPRRDEHATPMNVPPAAADDERQSAIERALDQVKRKHKRASRRQAAPPAPAPKGGHPIDGMGIAAGILRHAPRELRMRIAEEEPELFARLRKRMFSFDDLERTPPDSLGLVFTEIEPETAALALRFASPRLIQRAMASVSSRKADLIRDEIERSAQARVRLESVEEAQNDVLETALSLQAAGRIVIDPSDPDLAG